MELPKLEEVVKEVLEESIESRNDNFKLVLKVYKKLDIPVQFQFMDLMLEHSKYKLPSFESVVRARRKVVEKHPELKETEKVKELRGVQEDEYIQYALNF